MKKVIKSAYSQTEDPRWVLNITDPKELVRIGDSFAKEGDWFALSYVLDNKYAPASLLNKYIDYTHEDHLHGGTDTLNTEIANNPNSTPKILEKLVRSEWSDGFTLLRVSEHRNCPEWLEDEIYEDPRYREYQKGWWELHPDGGIDKSDLFEAATPAWEEMYPVLDDMGIFISGDSRGGDGEYIFVDENKGRSAEVESNTIDSKMIDIWENTSSKSARISKYKKLIHELPWV